MDKQLSILDDFYAEEQVEEVVEVAEEAVEEVVVMEKKKKKKEKTHTTKRGETFTDEEWKSPIVKNGPSRQEVEEWKDKYGESIYFTPFANGTVYVWRALDRPEYREILRMNDINMLDREEVITDKCVLYPRNFSCAELKHGSAGVPSILSEYIMDKSGFVAQSAPVKL